MYLQWAFKIEYLHSNFRGFRLSKYITDVTIAATPHEFWTLTQLDLAILKRILKTACRC